MHYSILKGFKNLNKVCERGTIILSIEGIRKGYLFRKKMLYKRVRGWTSGRSLPVHKYPFRVICKEDCQRAMSCYLLSLKKKAPKPVFTSIEFQKYRFSLRLFRHCNCYLSSVAMGWKDGRGL